MVRAGEGKGAEIQNTDLQHKTEKRHYVCVHIR